MPEGPEVYRIAEELKKEIAKKEVSGQPTKLLFIKEYRMVLMGESKRMDIISIPINSKIKKIQSYGKRLIIILNNHHTILISFALGGDIVYDKVFTESTKIAELEFSNKPNSSYTVTFTDPMRFASLTYATTSQVKRRSPKLLDGLLPAGIDPLRIICGMKQWLEICKKNEKKLVALFIVDQEIIAGVGNRYRSEIMHLAKCDPLARIKDLYQDDRELLLVQIYRVLNAYAKDPQPPEELVHDRKQTVEGEPVYKINVAKGVYVYSTINPTPAIKDDKEKTD